MEIYKVIFKDKQSLTVEADSVSQAIIEAERRRSFGKRETESKNSIKE